jgi:hypothetical protein
MLQRLPQETYTWKDVLRQQWNFSPPVTEDECKEYNVDLPFGRRAGFELFGNLSVGGPWPRFGRVLGGSGGRRPGERVGA